MQHQFDKSQNWQIPQDKSILKRILDKTIFKPVQFLFPNGQSKKEIKNTLLRFGLIGGLALGGIEVYNHVNDFKPESDIPILVHQTNQNSFVVRSWQKDPKSPLWLLQSVYIYASSSSNSSGGTGHFTWTVPVAEQLNTIQCWGGGAGGGSPATGNGYGGGGGGFSEKDGLTTSAGIILYLRVGPKGLGSDGNSTPAGDAGQTWASLSLNGSDFSPTNGSCLCRGVGGNNGDTNGLGSGFIEGTSGKQFTGGNGAGQNTAGPGGGSSAGTTANGNNGSSSGSTTPGAGGTAPSGGAAGGNGGGLSPVNTTSPTSGGAPGAGGGGDDSQSDWGGANGADGKIILTTSISGGPSIKQTMFMIVA